jgi:hypothetical protein
MPTLLLKLWPYLAGLALLSGGALWLHHSGYESGHAASEASWTQRFAEAERARDAANLAARNKEADSNRLTQMAEAEYAATLQTLHETSAAADQRIRALSVRIAAASASRCNVPALPGAPAVPDAAAASTARADGAGSRISDTGRRCERDAITLANLQAWLRGQQAILRSAQ